MVFVLTVYKKNFFFAPKTQYLYNTNMIPFPNKKYNTIVLDPPWNISMTGKVKREENRKEKLAYQTMSLKEIKSMDIKSLSNDGAHIYCWTTNKMLRDTYDVFDAWGVNYHLTLVWTKPSFIAPAMGYQFATEFLLLGFMGKPMQKFKTIGKKNWIYASQKRNGHSTKPDEFLDLIETMSPGPYLEMFARKTRHNWDSWGNEV